MSATGASSTPRILLVGFAGNQGQENLPIVSHAGILAGGVDFAPNAAKLANDWGFPYFTSIADAIRYSDFDVALVTVPHSEHFAVCAELLRHQKHVIKEKPFAVTTEEARELVELANAADKSVYTLVQRNFNSAFTVAREQLPRIGRLYWFSYEYHMNLVGPTRGWRAAGEHAVGGVLLDMGYHVIDVLAGLLPAPDDVRSTFLYCYDEMRDRGLEDFANVLCTYCTAELAGSVQISRHNHEKSERLSMLGSHGALNVSPRECVLYSLGGKEIDRHTVYEPKIQHTTNMLRQYLTALNDREYRSDHFRRQLVAVRLMERIYDTSSAGLMSSPARGIR